MFEKRSDAILPRRVYLRRQLIYGLVALSIIAASLLIGVLGFHYAGDETWIDSLENAAMILSGMGLVGAVTSNGGKLFASFYALFSGVVFLAAVSVLMAPAVHRILHLFHIESKG